MQKKRAELSNYVFYVTTLNRTIKASRVMRYSYRITHNLFIRILHLSNNLVHRGLNTETIQLLGSFSLFPSYTPKLCRLGLHLLKLLN